MTDQSEKTPTIIPFHEPTAALVRQLVAEGEKLELDLDLEPYSDDPADGHPKPKSLAAHAVKARPFARFQSSGFSILRAICGADGHPLCRQWLTDVHSPVVYAVRKGLGILDGFLVAWQLGGLWTASDEPQAGAPVAQKPEDFGRRTI